MAKLSRKDRYKDLRDSIQLDQGEPLAKPNHEQPATPDLQENSPSKQLVFPATHSVMDDLFDEVSTYNQNRSYSHLEDKQIEILNEISNSFDDMERRKSHLMTMEQKQEEGGTTRNLFSSDLSSVAQNAKVNKQNPVSSQGKIDLFADMKLNPVQSPTETKPSRSAQFREKIEADDRLNPKSNSKQQDLTNKKDQPKQRLSRTKSPEDLEQEQYFASEKPRRKSRQIIHDSSQDKPASKAALVFMVLCCIILSVLIGLTIFWMSKLRIF